MIGRNLNFMNIMFILLFASEIICGSFIIPSFFEVGEKNWNDDDPNPDEVMKPCGTWYSWSYLLLNIVFLKFKVICKVNLVRSHSNFCGIHQLWNALYQVNTKSISQKLQPVFVNDIFLERYIYVRFAADLLISGERLFNILISLAVLTFCLQWLIIWPFRGGWLLLNYQNDFLSQRAGSLTTTHWTKSRERFVPRLTSRNLMRERMMSISTSDPKSFYSLWVSIPRSDCIKTKEDLP